MTITKQQLIDKYNEVYAADNGVNKTFVELTKDEKVEALLQFVTTISGGSGGSDASASNQTTQIELVSPLDKYFPADIEEAATSYYGFTDKDENWYILRATATQNRFHSGSGNYATAWTNRASHSYDYFFNKF